jgi:hypothetical protein
MKTKLMVLSLLLVCGWAGWLYSLNVVMLQCDIANRDACIATLNGGDEALTQQLATKNNKNVAKVAQAVVGGLLLLSTYKLLVSKNKKESEGVL